MKEEFLQLLHDDLTSDEYNNLSKWLESTDFFTAPASTKYHGAHERGLLNHSLMVHKLLKEKNDRYDLGLTRRMVSVAGLLHDVCKANFYAKEKRWKKVNGQWESYEVWAVDDKVPLGHGEKSVILLQRYINLTVEEIYMIRWHMGPFSVLTGSSGVPYSYYDAVRKCPVITAMFTADYEASVFLED